MWKWLLGIGTILVVGAVVLGRKVAMGPSGNEKADESGLVQAEPFRLAEQRGVSLDIYALARMLVSEAGEKNKAAMTAVGWAAVNHAIARGESVSTVLLRGKGKSEGKFGGQNTGGKYASTKQVPSDATVALAKGILAHTVPDPTKGARQWDAPAAQNKMVGKVAGYTKTSADVAAERLKTNDMVMVSGVPAIRFWRPKGVVVA
jgi:hypothetical protein